MISKYFNPPPPKRKVFISYHHANDQGYYDLLSETFSEQYDIFTDRSLDREIDSDKPEYVMRVIREEYLKGSSCTIVLCGSETCNRKYVDWEIKATLDKGHALIGIQLPTNPEFYVHTRLYQNYKSKFAILETWKKILDPLTFKTLVKDAVQHANQNQALIRNSEPLMKRNK